tara:strand:- start:87 stop:821 length:735 start_codon:yes stop_codon:yes gene_type:complete
MADKISRRSFLKGTGKTILTAGVLSSGVGLSTSTTPTKVIPKVLKGFNPGLAPVTPRARAYRSYLRGVKEWSWFAGQLKGVEGRGAKLAPERRGIKSILTKQRMGTGERQAIAGQSPARQAFEQATSKKSAKTRKIVKVTHDIRQDNVARQIIVDPELKKHPSQRNRAIQSDIKNAQEAMIRNTSQVARKELARELREQRRLNKKMKTKSKGAKVGGGGKMALPGMESAKNPTGMSLVTQRYTL